MKTGKVQEKPGWAKPRASKKFHYFKDGMSLCDKWMYFDEDVFPDKDDSADNCPECWRRHTEKP